MSKLIPLKQIIQVEDPTKLVLPGGDGPVTLLIESGSSEFSGSVWVQDVGYLTDFSSSISSSFSASNDELNEVSASLELNKLNVSDYQVDSSSFDNRIEVAGIFKETGSFYSTTNDVEVTGSLKTSGSLEVSGSSNFNPGTDGEFNVFSTNLEFDFDEFNFAGLFTVSGSSVFEGPVNIGGIGDMVTFSSSIDTDFSASNADLNNFSSSIYDFLENTTFGIFEETGSFWATTNDIEVTGSISILGDVEQTGSIRTQGLSVDTQLDTEFAVSGSHFDFNFDTFDFGGIFIISGSSTFSGSVDVEGIGDLVTYSSSIDTELESKEDRLSVTSQTGSFTLTESNGTFIECNNGTDIQITIPTNATESFRTGYIVTLWQNDVGGVQVIGGSGVTVNGNPNTAEQYTAIQAVKVDTDRWNLIGGVA